MCITENDGKYDQGSPISNMHGLLHEDVPGLGVQGS